MLEVWLNPGGEVYHLARSPWGNSCRGIAEGEVSFQRILKADVGTLFREFPDEEGGLPCLPRPGCQNSRKTSKTFFEGLLEQPRE